MTGKNPAKQQVQRVSFKTTINIKILIKAPIFSFKGWKTHLRETRFKKGGKKASKLFSYAGGMHRCELLLNITVTAE